MDIKNIRHHNEPLIYGNPPEGEKFIENGKCYTSVPGELYISEGLKYTQGLNTIFNDIYIYSLGVWDNNSVSPISNVSQVDHIALSDAGIFVVETKKTAGAILKCSLEDEYWTRVGDSRKNKDSAGIPSPVLQNKKHIENLRAGCMSYLAYLEKTGKNHFNCTKEDVLNYPIHNIVAIVGSITFTTSRHKFEKQGIYILSHDVLNPENAGKFSLNLTKLVRKFDKKNKTDKAFHVQKLFLDYLLEVHNTRNQPERFREIVNIQKANTNYYTKFR